MVRQIKGANNSSNNSNSNKQQQQPATSTSIERNGSMHVYSDLYWYWYWYVIRRRYVSLLYWQRLVSFSESLSVTFIFIFIERLLMSAAVNGGLRFHHKVFFVVVILRDEQLIFFKYFNLFSTLLLHDISAIQH